MSFPSQKQIEALKEMKKLAHELQRATSCASQDDYMMGMDFTKRNEKARADVKPLLDQLNKIYSEVIN